MTVKKDSSPPKAFLIAAVLAGIALVIVIGFMLRRPFSGGAQDEGKIWKHIKQQERILILYESVIGVKAKQFDGKLKTYQYGINEQQLGGAFLGEDPQAPLTGDMMEKEMELQNEMDLIRILISQREELKEQVARMHFQRKIGAGPAENPPPPVSSPETSPAPKAS